MKRLLPALLVVTAACPKSARYPVEVKLEGAVYAERCGDVTAEWLGHLPEASAPKSYGTEGLRFRLPSGVISFEPQGQLTFSDWSFEVFSPDCAWVLLLQDSAGPYHLVATEQLGAYLRHEGPPAAVLQRPPQSSAAIHHQQRWLSATELEFFASCCGGVEVYQSSTLTPGVVRRVYFAPQAPKGLRRNAEGGYEVVP